MPKEQACLGERAARGASKNAKDKSNSAALLASRGKAGLDKGSSGQGSCCSSEKDSGYSDTGSDSLQTDLEDQHSVVRKHWPGGRGPGRNGDGAALHGGGAQICSAAEYRELGPIYILKNVVLKQPLTVPSGPEQLLHGQLAWGRGGLSTQSPTQLLFLQQPGVAGSAPLRILKPHPAKVGGSGKSSKGSYLPILNSYPRIAPHPSKKTPEQEKGSSKGAVGEVHSLSKRVCMEERREAVSSTVPAGKRYHHQPQEVKARPHTSSHLCLQDLGGAAPLRHTCQHTPAPQSCPRHGHQPTRCPPGSRGQGSPSVSSSEAPEPLPGSEEATAPRLSSKQSAARRRRFQNTVEILSQSGLLDITMRTQDLLRQNAATERDIAQLRQHAQLLCQAAQAGPDAVGAWEKLCQVMAESGRYPALSQLGSAETGCSCPAPAGDSGANKHNKPISSINQNNHDSEACPPSPLLAPTPDLLEYGGAEQDSPAHPSISPPPQQMANGDGATSPLDGDMPPDSSTHISLP